MTNKDGGPAFARSASQGWQPQTGLSLRDYFAAAALTGLLSDPEMYDSTPSTTKALATCSYAIADAMLAEREE